MQVPVDWLRAYRLGVRTLTSEHMQSPNMDQYCGQACLTSDGAERLCKSYRLSLGRIARASRSRPHQSARHIEMYDCFFHSRNLISWSMDSLLSESLSERVKGLECTEKTRRL